MTKSEHITI